MITLQCDNGSKMLTPETANKSGFLRGKLQKANTGNNNDSIAIGNGLQYPRTIILEENIEIVRKMCDFMISPEDRFPANQTHWLDKWDIPYRAADLIYTVNDIPKDTTLKISRRAMLFLGLNNGVYNCENGWTVELQQPRTVCTIDTSQKKLPCVCNNPSWGFMPNELIIPYKDLIENFSVYGELLDVIEELNDSSKTFDLVIETKKA